MRTTPPLWAARRSMPATPATPAPSAPPRIAATSSDAPHCTSHSKTTALHCTSLHITPARRLVRSDPLCAPPANQLPLSRSAAAASRAGCVRRQLAARPSRQAAGGGPPAWPRPAGSGREPWQRTARRPARVTSCGPRGGSHESIIQGCQLCALVS